MRTKNVNLRRQTGFLLLDYGFVKVQNHFVVLHYDFAGLQNHFVVLHYDFAGLQNYFAALHYDFVGLQNRFGLLNYDFVKVQNHFSRMQYVFSGAGKGLGGMLQRIFIKMEPPSIRGNNNSMSGTRLTISRHSNRTGRDRKMKISPIV